MKSTSLYILMEVETPEQYEIWTYDGNRDKKPVSPNNDKTDITKHEFIAGGLSEGRAAELLGTLSRKAMIRYVAAKLSDKKFPNLEFYIRGADDLTYLIYSESQRRVFGDDERFRTVTLYRFLGMYYRKETMEVEIARLRKFNITATVIARNDRELRKKQIKHRGGTRGGNLGEILELLEDEWERGNNALPNHSMRIGIQVPDVVAQVLNEMTEDSRNIVLEHLVRSIMEGSAASQQAIVRPEGIVLSNAIPFVPNAIPSVSLPIPESSNNEADDEGALEGIINALRRFIAEDDSQD